MNLVIRFVLQLRSKVGLRMNEDEFFHKDFRFKMAADYCTMVGIIVYSFQSNKINGSSYTSINPIYCSRKILKFTGLFGIKTVLARFFMLQVYFLFFDESGKITRILWPIKYFVYRTIY